MAEDAEKKNISRLDFNINDAISSLDQINQKLESISKSSEAYAKKISKNIESSFDFAHLINADSISKELSKVTEISEKDAKKLVAKIMNQEISVTANAKKEAEKRKTIKTKATTDVYKSEVKTADKIKLVEANTASYKEKRAADAALAQEKANLRVLNSTKTIYDKIAEYAKTYIIYQGFNQLRQSVTETIDEMVEMEYQMVQIERVLNDSSLNIDIYRDKLIQMAHDYANSFENVADITLRLAQAGYDADESLALTEKTLLALNTAELDATQATDDMVAVMAQWGLMTGTASEQAETYGNIIDKINKVADNFPTTSADILDALKKTSSAFNLAGASIDETIATIVAAEKASQRGGKTIGTALSNITQQLKAEGKLEIAEKLGLDFFTDANKTQFKPIMEIFQEMAERMQNLKDQGKESSVEMQNLLELFTVFRRNIGASLLGEMAGEDSTYAQVLSTSLNSVGYSLQENAKHMETAKAAQAQFNAELLKLKTQVWEGGLEDVFRELLNLGTDLIEGIGGLIEKFGILPVSVAAVTLAFTLLNKNTQASNWVGLKAKIKEVNVELNKTTINAKGLNTALKGTNAGFQSYVKSLDKGKASMMGYLGYQIKATTQTILLTAKTILLQAAISGVITFAISALVSAIENWVNAEEKAIEANEKIIESSKENAENINNEILSIQELRKEYEELAKKDNRTTEENQKIYEIQEKINALIKDTGKQVELVTTQTNDQGEAVQKVNEKYKEQLDLIESIEFEKKKDETDELRKAAEAALENLKGTSLNATDTFWNNFWETSSQRIHSDLEKIGYDIETYMRDELGATFGSIGNFANIFNNVFESLDYEKQYEFLYEMRSVFKEASKEGEDYSKSLELIEAAIERLDSQYNGAKDAIEAYKQALGEIAEETGMISNFNTFLDSISGTYELEGPRQLVEAIKGINQEFENGTIDVEEYFNKIQEKIEAINLNATAEELEAYQAIFAATTQSLAEGFESIQAGFDSGISSFADYSQGVAESAETSLDLFTKVNKLSQDAEGQWIGASEDINGYANSLQSAMNELSTFESLLTTIGDNYDYISEHANASGEAIFNASQVGTEAYNNLANSMVTSLNQMKDSNYTAFENIVNDIAASTQKSTNEILNANGYINNGLFENSDALNTALNSSAKQVGTTVSKVTTAMGNVFTALGNAISNFDYTLSGSLVATNEKTFDFFGKQITLPTKIGYRIVGTGGSSITGLSAALSEFGTAVSGLGTQDFTYKPKVLGGYNSGNTSSGSKNKPTSPSAPSSPKGSGGGSSSSDKSDYYAEREAERAKKAEEDAYKERLAAFEDYIDNKEEDEENWVKRQRELNQLSNEDFLYITQQRIERYKKYLEEVEKATWIKEEDKMKLRREYSEKIKDLEVDYLGYLEDQLNAEIEAIEDANDEKIKLIEEEADAKIAALKKVEEERDRERETEDYQKERQSILDEIAYWEQRTGREAQENLVRARKELEQLDSDWEDTQEDWKTEDQIKDIEARRDAEIAAIEAAEKKEIESLKAMYDAKAKLYVETGNLIYDESVIQSQSLYNAYKTNFIDPISSELSKINVAPTTTQTTQNQTQAEEKKQQYETYTIKSGDTLSKIAKKYGTTVEKLMAANPYITNKNKIFAGKTLQIPKFHEGGIVGGTQEAFALLKPNEVILKTEWAASLNRMMKYFDGVTTGKTNSFGNNPVIEVKGNLIQIDADIKSKSDVDYLERRIEKMLKSKFNIKK